VDLRSALLPPADEPWITNGGIISGAVVRSAAIGLRSSGARSTGRMTGRGSPLVDALLNMPASLWVERMSMHMWSVTLGLRDTDPAKVRYDWQLTVQCTPDASGAAVQIRTPRYRMTDGALVHGDLHDHLREAIADGFTNGAGNAQDAEVLISRRGLARAHWPGGQAALDGLPRAFEIQTNLSADQVHHALLRVGFPVLAATGDDRAWRLGLSDDSRATVTVSEAGGRRRVAGCLTIAPTGNRTADHILWRSARTFCDRLLNLIHQADPKVQWQVAASAGPAVEEVNQ
jgi:hypothetical protein